MSIAAQKKTGSLRNSVLDMFLDFLHGGLVDQRTLENPWIEAIADFKFLDRGDEFLGKRIINACLDVKTVGTDTGLAGISVFGNDRTFDRRIQIRIVEDDKGGVST